MKYSTCPCGGAVSVPDRGRTRVFCKHCKRWLQVQDGIVYGYA